MQKKNRVSEEDNTDGESSTPSRPTCLPPPQKLVNEVRQWLKAVKYRVSFYDVEILGPFPTDDLQGMWWF